MRSSLTSMTQRGIWCQLTHNYKNKNIFSLHFLTLTPVQIFFFFWLYSSPVPFSLSLHPSSSYFLLLKEQFLKSLPSLVILGNFILWFETFSLQLKTDFFFLHSASWLWNTLLSVPPHLPSQASPPHLSSSSSLKSLVSLVWYCSLDKPVAN